MSHIKAPKKPGRLREHVQRRVGVQFHKSLAPIARGKGRMKFGNPGDEVKQRRRFIQIYEGDGLEICKDSHFFRLKCCKCGLVHEIDVEHRKHSVVLRFK